MLPGLDRYDADPVQPLTQAGEGLDDLDCDLPDLNDLSDLDHDLSDLNDLDYIVLTDAGLHSSGSTRKKEKKNVDYRRDEVKHPLFFLKFGLCFLVFT